ncbi:hypothetical protein [uncultured Flavobacterium sp.]|uniref:hypothetical protein n=1 Tax=uncultured Flavobacterium sp. TaxID=165435 RepID=UPI0025E56117|nr:hypothetical protein [uncultured Flavobacterium sp.]
MKKIILFTILAVMAVSAAGYAQIVIMGNDKPMDCDGCGGGDRVCCANTTQNFG